jgi:tetratricopeptide (TPR) repeat protein
MIALASVAWLGFTCAPLNAADNAYLDQGIALYQQKNYRAAVVCFNQAIAADRNNASPYFYLANCAYALGDRKSAIKIHWFVAHHFPSAKEAYSSRDILRTLDPDYSRNSTIPTASTTPTMATRSAAAAPGGLSEASNQSLVDDLLVVVRSQGNRPNVSPKLVEATKQALYCYPPSLLTLLSKRRIKICLTPSTVDQDPRMQNTQPHGYEEGTTYKNCPGFFDGRHIVVCAYAVRGFDDSAWEPTEDPIGTLRHELGHAFDYCLGNVSTSDEFKHAYYMDVSRIPEENKPRLSYFLQLSDTGPRETFAEILCCDFGGRQRFRNNNTQLVRSSFKQAAAVAEQKLRQASQL